MLSQQLKAIQLEQQWSNIKYQIKLFCCKDFSSKLNNILPAAQSITVSFRWSTIYFRNSLNIQDSLWQIYFPSIYFNYQFLSCLAHLWLPSAYQVEGWEREGSREERGATLRNVHKYPYSLSQVHHQSLRMDAACEKSPFLFGVCVCVGRGMSPTPVSQISTVKEGRGGMRELWQWCEWGEEEAAQLMH